MVQRNLYGMRDDEWMEPKDLFAGAWVAIVDAVMAASAVLWGTISALLVYAQRGIWAPRQKKARSDHNEKKLLDQLNAGRPPEKSSQKGAPTRQGYVEDEDEGEDEVSG